jgi:hypothetical protein
MYDGKKCERIEIYFIKKSVQGKCIMEWLIINKWNDYSFVV